MDGPSVSVTAAFMPGVEAIAFHTEDSSLPAQVSGRQWGDLMRAAGGAAGAIDAVDATDDAADDTVGLVVLSDPDFVEVDDLMRRVHSLLPRSKLVGGAVKTGGAFFLVGSLLPSRGSVSSAGSLPRPVLSGRNPSLKPC